MITNGSHSRPTAIGATIQFLVRSKWVFTLAIAAIVTVAATLPPPVSDENTDEEYIRVMNLMDRADALRATGKADAAKAKDQEAYRALIIFQKTHPKWNKKTVDYRLNQLVQDIEGKSTESESEEPTRSKGKTNLEAPSRHTSTQTMSSVPAAVKLVDAGAEPRKALRLHVKAGDMQNVVITVKQNLSKDMAAAGGAEPNAVPKIPAISLPMDVTVQSVAANGDITYEMTFAEPSVAEEPGAPAQMVQAMKAALASFKGATATGVMSDRGVSKKMDIKLPSNANPQVRQALEQMKENMSGAYPEEPVGAGAKWEVKSAAKLSGISSDTITDCQLVSIDGDHLSTTFTQTKSVTNQKAQNAPEGGAQTSQNTSSTTGSVAVDLSKLMPLQATMDGHSEVNGMKVDSNITLEAH